MDKLSHWESDNGTFFSKEFAAGCSLCKGTINGVDGHVRLEMFREKLALTSQLYLEINRNCNLTCTHCYNDSGPSYRETLSLDNIRKLLDWQKKRNAPLKLVLISGGEPILHRSFAAILRTVREQGVNVKVITNGTTLTARVTNVLVEQGAYVQVSLTGHTVEEDGFIRGPYTFDRCLAGIKRLVAAGLGARLSVSVVVHKQNYCSISGIIDLLVDLGVQRIGFSTLSKEGRGASNWNEFRLSYAEWLETSLQVGRKREQYRDRVEIYTSGLEFTSLPSLIRGAPPLVLSCTAPYEVAVTYNGVVQVCEHFHRLCLDRNIRFDLNCVLGESEEPKS